MPISNTGNGSGLISAQGIGSGLDIQSLVSQLVTAEGATVATRLSRHASVVGTQLSALGTLKGALSAFQTVVAPLKDTKLFQSLTATAADGAGFTAAADKTAATGSYAVEVTQLAAAEQLISKDFAGGATSVLGTGSLTLTRGASTMTLTLTSDNNTLGGIRDAINAASNNPGIQATLINTGTGSRLVLTATETGAANTVRVTSSGGGLAQLEFSGVTNANWTLNQAAADASIRIAGVPVTRSTNTIANAIDGVTLTLTAATPGVSKTLNVASDQKTVIANVRRFVDGYNAMRAKFDSLSFYDAASRRSGPLLADPLMKSVDEQMRRISLNQVSGLPGIYTSLAAIGITSDTKGKLTIDESKLTAALAADRTAVAQLFGNTGGIAARLDSALTEQLASTGSIAARDKGLATDQQTITDQFTRHNARMSVVQQRYLSQFTALDTLMSQLKQTSTFLTQQLGSSSG
jgi:flagellar hook-associated protein 2